MSKFSVKRPFTVLVAVVMLIVLGIVSFMKLTTDLLPTISIPYVMVITTYPGASPERVESDVTQVLESALGTVNGVENVSSVSYENYSMVTLEFADDTNMDSAMVKLSTQVNQIELPENVGTPSLMEISPDLMATMYLAVDYDGGDIYSLTDFVDETIIPHMERQNGVASVTATGMVEESVEIRLDKAKVDKLNAKVLGIATDKLDEAQEELDDARAELNDAESELESGKNKLQDEQGKTTEELAKYSKQLDEAMATKAAYAAILVGLETDKIALEAELKAYKDNKVTKTYKQMNEAFATARATVQAPETYKAIYDAAYAQVRIAAVQQALAAAGMTNVTVDATNVESYLAMLGPDAAASIHAAADENAKKVADEQIQTQLAGIPTDVKDAIDNPDKLKAFRAMLEQQGQEEAAKNMTKKNLKQLYNIVETRIPQIKTELANLEIEIAATKEINKKIEESIAEAEAAYEEVEAGKITAAASFGAYTAQMESGLASIEEGKTQMEQAQEQLDESREAALESANMDALLSLETLSQLIAAQNFSMPAGYIDNEDDTQVLVKIGEEFETVEQIENMILCKVDKIGDVRISDVATVTIIDNADDSYAKLNGNDAVILSIMKSSTAGTSAVSETLRDTIEDLEKEYVGLHLTPLMDQGDYIGLIINSVLSNLIWGALLAIIVLAIFLKDYKPTLVVAFSIPMSVLFAIVLMFFSDVTLNMISLSGLALGVGMLVDNSIVVIENIYRLRNKGVSAARAAVMGAKQVAGAITASTLTTICVFLPIVFTTGLTRQLFTDMALTIGYSLVASLIVALTFVPCMSATVLKNANEKSHKWFDKMIELYDKAIRFCLKVKIAPMAVAIVLLVLCIVRVLNTGMVLLPSMGGNQMSMTMTVPAEWEVEEGYAAADDLLEKIKEIDGIVTVGIMSGGGGGDIMMSSGTNKDFSFFLILDDATGKDNGVVADKLEAIMQEGYADTEYTIATSNMDISALMSSGLQINVYGEDTDEILEVSNDMVALLEEVKGFENVSNGQEEADRQLEITIDKDKAMRHGLTVAQIFMELSGQLTTDADATTLNTEDGKYQVSIVDETEKITEDNLMDYEFTVKTTDDEGKEVEETHKLREFAEIAEGESIAQISRVNQERYITVSAETMDGYNTTLLSRQVEDKLEKYQVPDGIRVEIAGESTEVMSMMEDMLLMILLAVIFIYLIMVAQFQSLLSPFIVLFTIPLAFTGGFLGLMFTGEDLSMIAMMGFLVLAGVVVNNGIVFVDYTNQMRLAGMEKREALIETGKTRMRPILMTALTTILAMMTMALSKDASAVMSRGMVIVTIGGLAYATLMTLFVVPVMYDILFRREIKEVDIGDENDDSDLGGPV
ncbi:MAG: efflux RND transporter permease subunit [Lachnospiraceae bacterium]|nr:efflux RND transporter permease subunit [Lachnospiraceae bacterium]